MRLPLKGNSKKRTCWGYSFVLTDEHLEKDELDSLKFSYDQLGDCVLKRLKEVNRTSEQYTPQEQSEQRSTSLLQGLDLYTVLERARGDPIIDRFWKEVHTEPSFIDWQQIERGQEVFYRYGGAALTGLCFQSLGKPLYAHILLLIANCL